MMAAATLADNRRSPAFQQNKVVAEALQSLSWLAYTGPSCGELGCMHASPSTAAATISPSLHVPAGHGLWQRCICRSESLTNCGCCAPAGMHAPGQHISENWNSAEFYANKLLKEFRGVDENQVNWVKALKVNNATIMHSRIARSINADKDTAVVDCYQGRC